MRSVKCLDSYEPRVCRFLGTWQAEPGVVAAAVEHALKVGYRLVDAAYVYGNEAEVGQGIKAAINAGYVTRDDVCVVSKLWTTYSSRAELGLSKSLQALGLDYVDLFLVHYPIAMNPTGNDDRFPALATGERDVVWNHDHLATWKDMEALLQAGKTKSIGVCNYSVPYLKHLLANAKVVPAVNQIENHPLLPQQEVIDFSKSNGIHIMAYSPFGSSGSPLMNNGIIRELALKKNVGLGTILLSYGGKCDNEGHICQYRPHVSCLPTSIRANLERLTVAKGNTVLAKSVQPSRITSNLHIVDLSAEDLQAIGKCVDAGPQRFVYPPFRINLGFPDKPDGQRMLNGA